MKFGNRVKVNSSGTSAATLTLGAAVPKARTLAQAIGAGKISVGDTNVPFWVEDASGNWEAGLYTITSSTQITQTQRLDSSNNGSAVTFDGGTLTAANDVLAYHANSGFTDQNDVGYDIIVCAGQSKMCGRGAYDSMIDLPHPRIYQWGCLSSQTSRYQTIFSGQEPLHWPEGLNNNGGTTLTSPANAFARAYLNTVSSNRLVLLVPVAWGGTGLYGGTPRWAVGGDLRENSVTQVNAAVAAAQAQYPSSRVTHILWDQAEYDAATGVLQSQYSPALSALFADFRTRMTGASNAIIIVGGMIPEFIAQYSSAPGIDAAQKAVAAATPRCMFVAAPAGMTSDNTHLTAAGSRLDGIRWALAAVQAQWVTGVDTTAPTESSAAVADATPTYVDIAWSEAMDMNYTPAASSFTVSGHTAQSFAWLDNMHSRVTIGTPIVYGESATLGYVIPGANWLRDLAGNQMPGFSSKPITNNIAAPATALVVTATPNTVTVGSTINVTVTVDHPLKAGQTASATLAPPVAGDWGTGTTINLNSTTQSVSQSFTPSATGAGSFTATWNSGTPTLSNGSSASVTVNASATVPGAPTIGTATAGDTTASFAFAAPASNGGAAIDIYRLTVYKASDNTVVGTFTGSSSPIAATGLTDGAAVYGKIEAHNTVGYGAQSAASNTVTPLAETITVNTPTTQTVGTAFSVTGTYANGTPTALDYRLSDDSAGVWTQVASATISGGNFSFSITPSASSAGRTISVRDRNNTSASGTSGTYVVNAPAPSLDTLAHMAATGTAGVYQGDGTATFWGAGAGGGKFVGSATGDLEIIIQMLDVPNHATNGRGCGIGLDPVAYGTGNVGSYSVSDMFLMHRNDGCQCYSNGTGTTDTTGVNGAQNDYIRLKRVGSTVTAAVSHDAGSTWTTIKTWSSVSGTLYGCAEAIYTTSIKLISATGFA